MEVIIEGVLLLTILPILTTAYTTYAGSNTSVLVIGIASLIELVLVFGFIKYVWSRLTQMR